MCILWKNLSNKMIYSDKLLIEKLLLNKKPRKIRHAILGSEQKK